MADLTWQRFVLDEEDTGNERYAEITRSGTLLYVRSGRNREEPRIEIKQLASEAAAERSVASRIKKLRTLGYLEDGVVSRPVPEVSTRTDRAIERAERLAEARAVFDENLPLFVREWRALGFDPLLSFVVQCRGTRLHPREVTERCLELASRSFGVTFSLRSSTYDAEHGAVRAIPAGLVFEFYESPAGVLTITYGKLRGQGGWTDDVDIPGLKDELIARIRALPPE